MKNLSYSRYQFNPGCFREEIVCDILLKAIASLPSPDFTLCECLIEQHHHEVPQIGRLIFLHQLLETCDFRLFWVRNFFFCMIFMNNVKLLVTDVSMQLFLCFNVLYLSLISHYYLCGVNKKF